MKASAYQNIGECSMSIDVEFDSSRESDCREADMYIYKFFQTDKKEGDAIAD